MDLAVTILTTLSNLFLGLIVLLKNPKRKTNILFIFLSFIVSAWSVANYFSLKTINPGEALVWIRIVMAITAIMFPAILHLALNFPESNPKINKLFVSFDVLCTLAVALLSLTPLVFSHAVLSSGKVTPVPGPAVFIFGLQAVTHLIATIVILIKKLKATEGTVKEQIKYMLFGLSLTFILAFTTTFLFVVLFKNTTLVFLGPNYSFILIAAVTYAIIKHRLFDIRLLIARSISYSALLSILGIIYASGLFIVSSLITKQQTPIANLITSTLFALLIAYTFQPLRLILEKTTDKIFFKERYETESLLNLLSKTMATSLTLDELSKKVLEIITKNLRLTRSEFVLLVNESLHIIEDYKNDKHLELSKQGLEMLAKEKSMLVLDEMPEGQLKDFMRSHEISLAVPLSTTEHFIGMLVMGSKSSGETFFNQDINFLSILGPELAVALQNAQRFEEISKFNITLQNEVKKATTDLQSANAKLTQLDKVKDEFISIASHDLRSPLATVKNYIWMAKSELKVGSTKTEEYLAIASESNEHAIALVADMLDVSRIEAGRIELNPEKLDMKHETDLIVEELQKQATDKEINLSSNVPQGVFAHADKERIHQVITNLTGNALKFTPVKGSITIAGELKGENVEISVSDTGIGIKKEDIDKLFTKFGKLETGNAQGTGLGLYISKNIVELSGGKIWVESTPGKGSKFLFTLPASV